MTASPDLTPSSGRAGADRAAPPWRRPDLRRTALLLEVPVVVLIGAGLALFVAIAFSTATSYPRLQSLFNAVDPNREHNVTSWLNASLWLVAGVVVGGAAVRATRYRASWWVFAAACTYFSLDETVSLHERLNRPLAGATGDNPFLHYGWVVPGAAVTLLIVLLLLRLVLSLPDAARSGLLAGGALFVLGALGFELLESFNTTVLAGHVLTIILPAVEEWLEMTGVVLCIASVLHLFEHRTDGGATSVRLSASRAGP
jgi:hypothetical protein